MNNEIAFHPLTRLHLPLLEKWLQEEHVKPFYKEDISSTEAIVRKYGSYIEGFTVVRGQKKPISSFIISYRDEPIGYAQYYDAHDFPVQGKELNSVLGNAQINEGGEVAGLDLFIGHPAWIGRGLGSRLIKQLLQEHIWKRFSSCIVDPHPDNTRAIRAFEKAGFRTIPATDPYLMLSSATPVKPTFIRSSVYGVAIVEGNILVVRQKQGVHQGKWDLPGGGIDPEESIEQALRREMFEEVGMQFSTFSPLANLTATTDHPTEYFRLHQIGLIYRIENLQNIPAASAELHYSWMSKETLKTEPLTPFLTWVLSSMGEIQ